MSNKANFSPTLTFLVFHQWSRGHVMITHSPSFPVWCGGTFSLCFSFPCLVLVTVGKELNVETVHGVKSLDDTHLMPSRYEPRSPRLPRRPGWRSSSPVSVSHPILGAGEKSGPVPPVDRRLLITYSRCDGQNETTVGPGGTLLCHDV